MTLRSGNAIRSGRCVWLLVIWGILRFTGPLLGDAGVCRMRTVRDPWVISLWTPAVVSSASPTEMQVMIQRRDTGLLDAGVQVQLRLEPPAGAAIRPEEAYCGWPGDERFAPGSAAPGWPRTVGMRPGISPADGIHGIRLRLPAAGEWRLEVQVAGGAGRASAVTTLPVQTPLARLVSVWPSLLLPPVLILGYCLRQSLVRRRAG